MSRWLDWSEMYCCTIEKVSIDNYIIKYNYLFLFFH